QFDQQPIEVAAIADATHRAWLTTDDPRWLDDFESCRSWFCGHNDVGVEMFDRASSGGYDGLTPTGPNLNQGAESTLAMLSTLQERMPT
ncbi:MAG: glycosyltransferase, partial [Actinobacteria bacterium]|nr:glycosyltransferase [Actinomycetota bacterium]